MPMGMRAGRPSRLEHGGICGRKSWLVYCGSDSIFGSPSLLEQGGIRMFRRPKLSRRAWKRGEGAKEVDEEEADEATIGSLSVRGFEGASNAILSICHEESTPSPPITKRGSMGTARRKLLATGTSSTSFTRRRRRMRRSSCDVAPPLNFPRLTLAVHKIHSSHNEAAMRRTAAGAAGMQRGNIRDHQRQNSSGWQATIVECCSHESPSCRSGACSSLPFHETASPSTARAVPTVWSVKIERAECAASSSAQLAACTV
mmetsp:Transcript_5857/g.13596  ORF Transcript_5857/g.13596 Transcript_5857/m.13596 type:complete len:258 (-) Transcript_5857:101-874(-)